SCSNQPAISGGTEGGTGAAGTCTAPKRLTVGTIDKVDLVLVVDNSTSMADKQRLFALAIPELLQDLTNPPCVALTTGQPIAQQPTGPLDACPAGSKRVIPPVTDMHVGLLSSSLGSFGADGCPDKSPVSCSVGTVDPTPNDDHGHLVTRADPCGKTGVPT